MATGFEPASRSLLVRKGDPSTAIFGAPSHFSPPPPADAYDSQHRSAGQSPDTVIRIPSGGESDDDLDDGRFDAPFPPLEEFPAVARNKVKYGSLGQGMCENLVFLGSQYIDRSEQAKVSMLLPTRGTHQSLQLPSWPAEKMNPLPRRE